MVGEKAVHTIAEKRDRADKLALPMFLLSAFFLVLLAGIVVTWVDIPRVVELAQAEAIDLEANPDAAPLTAEQLDANEEAIELAGSADKFGFWLFVALLCIWPLFWIEYIYNYETRKREDGSRIIPLQPLFACIIPPLRLGAASSAWDDRMWLPSLSWQHPGRDLSALLERIFTKPMLIIALLILPILLIEFAFKGLVQEYYWLRLVLHFATGFIWFAFAFEFIIMVSATDKKIAYVKKNWIDLAIILIPLVSFLRTLRVLRLAKLAKIQKIARLGRVYRVRSLGMKVMRAFMMFGLVNKILNITADKRLAKLNAELEERSIEMDELKKEITQLEEKIAAKPPVA